MSWLKSAISRAAEAAEAGGRSIAPNLDKARSFVHSAGSAVAGGARAILDRSSPKNYNNFRHAVKRLNEVSASVSGEERQQALERWLGALLELEKELKIDVKEFGTTPSDVSPVIVEDDDAPQSKVVSVLFYDEKSDEPLTFRDVFLESQALENIALSMVSESASEGETKLILELFRLCLAGGPEIHHALVSGLQDLAKVVPNYNEILVNKEDIFNMVSEAVSGLKLNGEGERLKAEALRVDSELQSRLEGIQLKTEVSGTPPEFFLDHDTFSYQGQELLQIGAHLVDLLQRQKEAQVDRQLGDSEETRHMKIDKMKRAVEELKENEKAHKLKVADARKHKSEALLYRVTKAQEVQEREKVIASDMQVLQKRREELEAELAKVMSAISVQTQKHIELQEEKEQFDEASTNLVAHLAMQVDDLEEHLSNLISQHAGDTALAATWTSFLEDTWLLQSDSQREKAVALKESVAKTKAQVWKIALSALIFRKEEVDSLSDVLEATRDEVIKIQENETSESEGGEYSELAEKKFLQTEKRLKRCFMAVIEAQSLIKTLMIDYKEGDSPEKPQIFTLLQQIEEKRESFEKAGRPTLRLEVRPKNEKKLQKEKSSEAWVALPTEEGKPSEEVKPEEKEEGVEKLHKE